MKVGEKCKYSPPGAWLIQSMGYEPTNENENIVIERNEVDWNF